MYKPHVRFVVMKDPEYGLLVTMQMISHAGRDGKEADAFVLTNLSLKVATAVDCDERRGVTESDLH